MSTDIKPGQIWQWNSALPHEGGLVVTKTEGDNVHYRYEDESIAGEHHRDTEHFTERAHLVTDTTPAPLDPSKVKAGDTVTVSLEGAHVTDVVASWEHNPASDHYRAYLTHDPDPFDAKPFRLVGNTAYTLTDHQPAPEPEPEWKPGTSGTATVDGTEGVRGTWGALHDGELYFMIHDSRPVGRLSSTRKYVSDFVPDEHRPLPTRDEVAVLLGDHFVKASRNLGQYRNEHECDCGATWITDGHSYEQQPTMYTHVADVTLALLRGETR